MYLKYFNENVFTFEKKNNIIGDKFLGISGTIASIMTPESDLGRVYNLQACPVSNTGFDFKLSFAEKSIPASDWKWLANAMYRFGETENFAVESTTVLPPDTNFAVMQVVLKNKTAKEITVPLKLEYSGEARTLIDWMFLIPDSWKLPEWRFLNPEYDGEHGLMTISQVKNGATFYLSEDAVTAITSSIYGFISEENKCLTANTEIILQPNDSETVWFSIHLGGKEKVIDEINKVTADYARYVDSAFSWVEKETEQVLSKLPKFKSSNESLEKLYYRSLVTYISNKWDNPEMAIRPFYSTGANNGGCMCSYLWDYSGGTYLHPLVDPETHKKQMELCLVNDLTNSLAIKPVDGKPCGNWYQINQEKIIMMVYYYVLHTNDIEYLNKQVGDKTILEWMIFHSLVLDDASKPVELIDYGQGGVAHLELRHELQYRGVMPDLNARRYMNYMRTYEMSVVAGKPCEMMKERAEQLKPLIMTLWNEDAKWFDFIWEGQKELRFTVQMFKFLTSDVVSQEIKEKLLSHLNETEFLSEYGLHSMSKLDPAYDIVDIDNGGGGICTEFAAVIIGQLYDIGKEDLASDILRRILWWGEKLPYLGDSCAAYTMLQREDTPLQCDISSVSLAQVILFNIIGLKVSFDGKISICPPKNHLANRLEYKNFKLLGKNFDVVVDNQEYSVYIEGETITKKCGEIFTF